MFESVKIWVRYIFQMSLDRAYLPQTWKTAKIVVIRKPGKADYTAAKAYRPISLLQTLSKALELIIVRRLSYLTETYGLLPENHFGGRRQRSCEQALNILVEKIHDAWRVSKVLSLVTFDVQGAFNGIYTEVLCQRLTQRWIPIELVKWLASFCSDRRAAVVVGKYTSEERLIEHAGLPQGSPLSPICFDYYNANLVEGPIDGKRGSLGFIDDYSAWVVGASTEENTTLIQNTIIPKASRWAEESGAVFEAEKTGFIHFTKKRTTDRAPLTFNTTQIPPQESVKLLGVTMDSRLSMRQHVQKVTSKALKVVGSIRTLKDLHPTQKRQLYQSTVTPIMDYAASVWYAQGKYGTKDHLKDIEKVQSRGASMITGAFQTVCLKVAQAEAYLEPVEQRLARKVLSHVVNLTTMPHTIPVTKVLRKTLSQGKAHQTPLRATWDQYGKYLAQGKDFKIAPELPWNVPTWVSFTRMKVDYSEEEALKFHSTAHQNSCNLYTDGSVRNGLCGSAVVKGLHLYERIKTVTVGFERHCSILTTEAMALVYAVRYVYDTMTKRQLPLIFTDSKRLLDQVAKGDKGGIEANVFVTLLNLLREVAQAGIRLTIRWIPAHKGIIGNEKADQAARDMTIVGRVPTGKLIVEKRKVIQVLDKVAVERARREYSRGDHRKFTWRLDGALPGTHTRQLYRNLSSEQGRVLAQARTGHNHLNAYRARIKVIESGMCECGKGIEDIQHLLVRCPLWRAQREALRKEAKDRVNDVSFLLGGWSKRRAWRTGRPVDGEITTWKPNLAVVKAAVLFLQSTGRMEAKEEGRRGSRENGSR